jgi:hypothetical protein
MPPFKFTAASAVHPYFLQPVIVPKLWFKIMTALLLCIRKVPGSNLSINQLIVVMVKSCVFFAVRTKLLNIIDELRLQMVNGHLLWRPKCVSWAQKCVGNPHMGLTSQPRTHVDNPPWWSLHPASKALGTQQRSLIPDNSDVTSFGKARGHILANATFLRCVRPTFRNLWIRCDVTFDCWHWISRVSYVGV